MRRAADQTPSSNGDDGRARDGRFAKGWKGGPGNPFIKRVAALRSALLDEVEESDVRRIVRKMIRMAVRGDVAAAKVVLERSLGKVPENLLTEIGGMFQRLESLLWEQRYHADRRASLGFSDEDRE